MLAARGLWWQLGSWNHTISLLRGFLLPPLCSGGPLPSWLACVLCSAAHVQVVVVWKRPGVVHMPPLNMRFTRLHRVQRACGIGIWPCPVLLGLCVGFMIILGWPDLAWMAQMAGSSGSLIERQVIQFAACAFSLLARAAQVTCQPPFFKLGFWWHAAIAGAQLYFYVGM